MLGNPGPRPTLTTCGHILFSLLVSISVLLRMRATEVRWTGWDISGTRCCAILGTRFTATGNLPCASETRVELFVHFGHTPAPLDIQFLLRHPSRGFNGFSVCHDLCGRVFGWAFCVYAGVGIGVDIGVEIGVGVEAGAEGRLPIRVEYEHGLRYRSEVEVVMDSDADIGGATAATLLSNDVPLPCPHHGGVRPDRAT
ncbi:hypothetical protein BC936DRAFT_148168 [Jimgerdemannia flammicorona]|uniref:Uncharacterized protein n=1 Tax=Jimgerdemannia flammicorona TaxID=994334 RepID=A0A433D3P7_9FUNG|nr:hypothetical protein BC936DRAFT_148168 [Jimgerdemannia flammicorona]